jgi:hypothetical protein
LFYIGLMFCKIKKKGRNKLEVVCPRLPNNSACCGTNYFFPFASFLYHLQLYHYYFIFRLILSIRFKNFWKSTHFLMGGFGSLTIQILLIQLSISFIVNDILFKLNTLHWLCTKNTDKLNQPSSNQAKRCQTIMISIGSIPIWV